jgi:inorganic phosphate transporter, PiT family
VSDELLVVVIVAALAFDVTNGFHDTATAIATSVSTRALTPRAAVALAAAGNLFGALLSTAVATTVATSLLVADQATGDALLAGLLAAIAWNLGTWYLGLPSSSSHALIGGLIGAAFAAGGTDAVRWSEVGSRFVLPALIAPPIGFAVAYLAMLALVRMSGGRSRRGAVRPMRRAQVAAAGLVAVAHGANDAQKTMGVIAIALLAAGTQDELSIPRWTVYAAAAALAFGTYLGGWRIVRTLGQRIARLEPAHGFVAESTAACVLYGTAALGVPVSTTHVIGGSIAGVGATRRASAVRWRVAADIVGAWVLTVPVTAALAAAGIGLTSLF